jgi:hypothetical protein
MNIILKIDLLKFEMIGDFYEERINFIKFIR